MSLWLLAIAAGVLLALVQYGVRVLGAGGTSLAAALLRVCAVTLIVALLLDAPAGCAKPVATWAALDASLSMSRGDSAIWRAARFCRPRARRVGVRVWGLGSAGARHDRAARRIVATQAGSGARARRRASARRGHR